MQANWPCQCDLPQAKPGSQEYSGRLLTAINSANGPVQLQSIVSQHGDFMDGPVIAAVLGRLAGFALMDNLRPKQVRGLCAT